ncbi:hypothetical protein FNV43_RR21504 [Rhamnella rubrinervis]|uniref:RecQ-mediated genome instability protein 1 n=1 Tax=Rhamnella rubrinervis TaxID=2594499 RepID=A0A8K0DWR6_9ROSA|nr:hypothetical protein FNV43_RR21504 [Rhamnella rubrinervis]
MPRRRLRLSTSSDDDVETEDHQPQQDQQAQLQPSIVGHPSVNLPPPNPNPTHSVPLEISDEDNFIDVSDNLSTPSPPPAAPNSIQHPLQVALQSSGGCPMSEFLQGLGLRVKREWLNACVHGLERSVADFAGLDVAVKAKHVFEQFLVSDMNYSGGGGLPENVDSLHLVDLPGPYVLQVDEIVNLSCPLKGRYQKAPTGIKRCAKMSMTDGIQRVFGMEYRPIKDLDVLAPAGLKVAICNVQVRRGLLMLVPESFEVLGGLVEESDAARQRLVEEVNKPARGKRTKTVVVPPLMTRATLAAWQSSDAHNNTNHNMFQETTLNQLHNQGATFAASRRDTGQGTLEDFLVPGNEDTAFPKPSRSCNILCAEEIHMDAVPWSRSNGMPNPSTEIALVGEETDMDAVPYSRPNPMSEPSLNNFANDETVEHPLLLSGDGELPFTYLASLSAKWASAMRECAHSVQGKVKCFLTGVKGFQYKRRTTYDLRVYVDDGSLISEILIDHKVVQKGIGYSPEEVTAALSSSDMSTVRDMKDVMKQFQIFLVNFEGIVLVEMNENSPVPVALEMNQGCSESDAWLLLRRLKAPTLVQTPRTMTIEKDGDQSTSILHAGLFLVMNHNQCHDAYLDSEDSSQIYEIKTRLWKMQQGDREVTYYYIEMKATWQELDLLTEETWACVGDIASPCLPHVKFFQKSDERKIDTRHVGYYIGSLRIGNPNRLEDFKLQVMVDIRHQSIILKHPMTLAQKMRLSAFNNAFNSDKLEQIYKNFSSLQSSDSTVSTSSLAHKGIVDGSLSSVVGKGNIQLSESIMLDSELSSGMTIGSARECDGLYYFEEPSMHKQGYKPSDIPIVAGSREEEIRGLIDKERYQWLIWKLIYISYTRPDITFIMNVVS